MYSHPHYLAFIREDGSTDPPELPFGLRLGDEAPRSEPADELPRQRLLSSIRQQLLPFLEDVLEFGLGYEAGRLAKTLQMTTAIVHYYPETTRKEKNWEDTSAVVASGNVESTAGIYGLRGGSTRPCIRRFRYGEAFGGAPVNSSVINLFVGGYLQALSRGRWRSLLHSGSNPSNRLSITIFLGIPQLHDAIGQHVHTRGEQEHRVYEWISSSEMDDDWLATAKFEEIQAPEG
eukprot:Skav213335  [mRNA]  locus=scaffold3340:351144:361292:+ [translate_table: standard]